VYTAAIDRQLNHHGCIVPGPGEPGELFGTHKAGDP
jgi:uracil phosphoribosyltransferase